MRILHVGKYYASHYGGIESFVGDLALEQVRVGHDVLVLAHGGASSRIRNREDFGGVEVRRVFSFGKLCHVPVAPFFGFVLWGLVGRFKPDVIHVHMPNVSALWLLLGRVKCPVVVHWHTDVAPAEHSLCGKFFYGPYKFMGERLLRRADAVIATSRQYLETSSALSRFRAKAYVIPLGLSPARLGSGAEAVGAENKAGDALRILAVGRFANYKGFEVLVRALVKVPDVHLTIVGDGNLRPQLITLVEELDLPCRVAMPGHVDDVELQTLFRNADVFCLPSTERSEAFGVVLLEAMYYGKPLITTSVEGSGMNWVNTHGETGLSVAPKDVDTLAEALWLLANDASMRQRMGKKARERFDKLFHIRVVGERIDDLYKEVVARKNTARAGRAKAL